MGKSYYNVESLTQTRKKLRNEQTKHERILWNVLKRSSFMWLKFRRQHSIGRYIIDFYCSFNRVGIEVDGKNHEEEEVIEYDAIRTEYLETAWIRILRFPNEEIENNLSWVLERLKDFIKHLS